MQSPTDKIKSLEDICQDKETIDLIKYIAKESNAQKVSLVDQEYLNNISKKNKRKFIDRLFIIINILTINIFSSIFIGITKEIT